ncbi:MAG: tryptophan synthase subunit alpha [Candidatus Magasanikbacteria bacterium RIFOXYD2_FULL_41_14]|uniref:Tryptophan synthase alpha chain n=1 Tax=Candidatus Magasanikbacteria bacterium RIFOXYD2_FULL_41_14 TaxID=1798709 RepID=A0A1F6PD16_9BACT|nr:MAG: tryptophan synthase subunit alpha [Candidatus Magasanikbacteria bacterium RIFOXYD2_FULL_41_14]
MNQIELQCQKIKQEKRLGIMSHVVVGYPNLEETQKIVLMMARFGVDFIELQIPFSDPVGDGPVIRDANTVALAQGVKVKDAFELVKKLKQTDKIQTPLFFMTYFNIPFSYGLEKFCADSAAIGISGLIIPDYNLDMESREHFDELCRKHNLILQRFAGLDSEANRLVAQAKDAGGFIYCFSRRGITGVRPDLDPNLDDYLGKLKNIFKQPLAVGFGISSGEQIQALKGRADIAIVGSAFLKSYNEGGLSGVEDKLKELVSARDQS